MQLHDAKLFIQDINTYVRIFDEQSLSLIPVLPEY